MPSGAKKRRSARKKKELEETFKQAPDVQESNAETTTDSVLTKVEQDLPAVQEDEEGESLDSKKNNLSQDLVPDDSIPVSEQISETEIPKMGIQTEEEAFVIENSKSMEEEESFQRTIIQELQGTMEQVEDFKRILVQGLQAVEKLTGLLEKVVDDLNNSQLIGGQ